MCLSLGRKILTFHLFEFTQKHGKDKNILKTMEENENTDFS
jgi:hypothetical protein